MRAHRPTRQRIPQQRLTMKFLVMVKSSEKYREQAPPAALMEAMGKFSQEGFASGRVVDTGGRYVHGGQRSSRRLGNRQVRLQSGSAGELQNIHGAAQPTLARVGGNVRVVRDRGVRLRLDALVQTSNAVAGASGRLEKISKLAALLKQLAPDEIPIAIGCFVGWPRQGRIGVGWATVAEARETEPAATATLDLLDVDQTFDALQATKGKGSAAERLRLLRGLFARATADEQQFLTAL